MLLLVACGVLPQLLVACSSSDDADTASGGVGNGVGGVAGVNVGGAPVSAGGAAGVNGGGSSGGGGGVAFAGANAGGGLPGGTNPTGGVGGSLGGGTGTSAGTSAGGSGGMSNGGSGGGNFGGNAGASGGGGMSGMSGSGGTGGGVCQKPTAPSDMKATIDLTWKEMTGGFAGKTGARPVSAGVQNFKNAVLDQVMEGGGALNFCVRYESNVKVTAAQRDLVAAALQRGVDEWFAKIKGYDCFPYDKVTTKISGWATVNRATFDWADGGAPIYVNQIGNENVAQCPDACSRFARYHANQSTKGYTYPSCTGGVANHFDMHLWLTEGMGFGGAGGDWGQRLDRQYFMDGVSSAHQHIWLHEFGHGFGFPDYYEWDAWAPGVATPNSVMVSGVATLVTDWDQWMLRQTWSTLKSRWQ